MMMMIMMVVIVILVLVLVLVMMATGSTLSLTTYKLPISGLEQAAQSLTLSLFLISSLVCSNGNSSVHLKQESANYSLGAISGLLPVSVNKVLLEHSHTHLFIYCL